MCAGRLGDKAEIESRNFTRERCSPLHPRLPPFIYKFTTDTVPSRLKTPPGKQRSRRRVNPDKKVKHMGDRSPKSTQKLSSQKQTKASSADQKKKQAVTAKQEVKKK